MKPRLFSFDIFGTVLDWRRGLRADLAGLGRSLSDAEFDDIVDAQGRDEQAAFRPYVEITARSLETELGLCVAAAKQIGSGLGHWPAYADSAEGLRRLLQIAPCVALTNSDREHRVAADLVDLARIASRAAREDDCAAKPRVV